MERVLLLLGGILLYYALERHLLSQSSFFVDSGVCKIIIQFLGTRSSSVYFDCFPAVVLTVT